MAARFINRVATINAGESLSDVIDCSTGEPIAIHMPVDWTPARLSFQISPDGISFGDLFDNNAVEVAFYILAGTSLVLQTGWVPILYLKIRSGGRNAPVPQELTRIINVTIDSAV